jgi:hypothetical protein
LEGVDLQRNHSRHLTVVGIRGGTLSLSLSLRALPVAMSHVLDPSKLRGLLPTLRQNLAALAAAKPVNRFPEPVRTRV